MNDQDSQPIGGASLRFTASEPALLRVNDRGRVESLGGVSEQTFVEVASGSRLRRVPVTIVPGPLHRLEKVSGDAQQTRAGEAVPEVLLLRALDAWGNGIAGAPLRVSEIAGDGDAELTTTPEGELRIEPPVLTVAGTHRIAVAPAGEDSPRTEFTVSVTPAAPARLAVLEQTAVETTEAGSEAVVRLKVSDTYDNPVPGVELQLVTNEAADSPAPVRTDQQGIATLRLPTPTARGARRPKSHTVALVSDPSISTTITVPPAVPPG